MHEKRFETHTCTKEIDIPKCDLCKRDLSGMRNESMYPSEQVLLPIFIGFDERRETGYYNAEFGSIYGIKGIELCEYCREEWFKDILAMFPNSKLVDNKLM